MWQALDFAYNLLKWDPSPPFSLILLSYKMILCPWPAGLGKNQLKKKKRAEWNIL